MYIISQVLSRYELRCLPNDFISLIKQTHPCSNYLIFGLVYVVKKIMTCQHNTKMSCCIMTQWYHLISWSARWNAVKTFSKRKLAKYSCIWFLNKIHKVFVHPNTAFLWRHSTFHCSRNWTSSCWLELNYIFYTSIRN